MAFKFPSDEWIKELSRLLNESDAYEKSDKDWEGDFLFVSDPDDTYPEKAFMYLGLYHGKSTGAAMVSSEDERETAYKLRAPAATWRKVIEGKLDPIKGMMAGQLQLTGDMLKVMRYTKAAQEIVACCQRVPTDFGD